ncbi:hypothetical protein F2P81_016276 [Scophthalmus maximus]|uniref:Uncharacterized protein n=1 Tax=Scophthalmus maximus TaxID=52904 RepID=A0A6A4SKR0_SCOMX|nr:hypothetical protein F2P81_016276 [Scophthalmus maximus]
MSWIPRRTTETKLVHFQRTADDNSAEMRNNKIQASNVDQSSLQQCESYANTVVVTYGKRQVVKQVNVETLHFRQSKILQLRKANLFLSVKPRDKTGSVGINMNSLANNRQAAGYQRLDNGPTTMTRGSWQILVFVYTSISAARMAFEGHSDAVFVLRHDDARHLIRGSSFTAAAASSALQQAGCRKTHLHVCMAAPNRVYPLYGNSEQCVLSASRGWSSPGTTLYAAVMSDNLQMCIHMSSSVYTIGLCYRLIAIQQKRSGYTLQTCVKPTEHSRMCFG